MTSDADEFWTEIAPKYRLYKHLCPLTAEEAEAAFDNAPAIAMTAEEIQVIVDGVVADESRDWEPDPQEWYNDERLNQVKDEMFAIHRDEGESDPETDAKEDESRKRMLNDESPNQQNGVDGRTTPSGDGGKDG